MRNVVLLLILSALVLQCQAVQGQDENNDEIDKYISRLRRRIETSYEYRMLELQQRAESEIRLLDVADKGCFSSLAAQAEVAKTVLHVNTYGYQAPWFRKAKTERTLQLKGDFERLPLVKDELEYSAKRFAVAQTRITERKNRVLAKLQCEAIDLEKHKQYALTTGLEALEKRLRENMLAPEPQAPPRVVTGIVYSEDKPSAIIDRNVVHEGQTVHGVKVVKISRSRVEFEKQGSRWSQSVGGPAGAGWSN